MGRHGPGRSGWFSGSQESTRFGAHTPTQTGSHTSNQSPPSIQTSHRAISTMKPYSGAPRLGPSACLRQAPPRPNPRLGGGRGGRRRRPPPFCPSGQATPPRTRADQATSTTPTRTDPQSHTHTIIIQVHLYIAKPTIMLRRVVVCAALLFLGSLAAANKASPSGCDGLRLLFKASPEVVARVLVRGSVRVCVCVRQASMFGGGAERREANRARGGYRWA